jgi:hypothetical protein
MKVLDSIFVGGMMAESLALGVPLILDRVGGPQAKEVDPINDSILHFDAAFARETYACFPLRADDRGTHAEKKGPLFHVKPHRVCGREGKAEGRTDTTGAVLLTPDNGLVRKVNPAIRLWSYKPLQLNSYLLSQDVANRREFTTANYKA